MSKRTVAGFLVVIGLVLFIMMGCGPMRETATELSLEDTRNIDTMRDMSVTLIENWSYKSGLIRCYLGDRMAEMPVRFLTAMNELDEMYDHRDALTDRGFGCVMGSHLKLTGEIIMDTLKIYAPELLPYLPLVL